MTKRERETKSDLNIYENTFDIFILCTIWATFWNRLLLFWSTSIKFTIFYAVWKESIDSIQKSLVPTSKFAHKRTWAKKNESKNLLLRRMAKTTEKKTSYSDKCNECWWCAVYGVNVYDYNYHHYFDRASYLLINIFTKISALELNSENHGVSVGFRFIFYYYLLNFHHPIRLPSIYLKILENR